MLGNGACCAPHAPARRLLSLSAIPKKESFFLPFLCPVLYTDSTRSRLRHGRQLQQRFKTTSVPVAQNQNFQSSNARISTIRKVGLATASQSVADDARQMGQGQAPWDMMTSGHQKDKPKTTVHATLAHLSDPPSPLVLDLSPLPLQGSLPSTNSVTGDLNHIHQNLHACLRVGRLDRARTLLQRLNQIYAPDAPGLLAAHQDYLRESTFRVVRTQDQQMLRDLLDWFEVEIRHRGVPLDASTFALIVQAALQCSNKGDKTRLVQRYHKMADEKGVGNETRELVLQLEPLLSQEPENPPLPDSKKPISADHGEELPSNLPKLKSMNIKGLGLSTLKRALASVSKEGANAANNEREVLTDRARQQILERNTTMAALDRWRTDSEKLRRLGLSSGSPPSIGSLLWQWHEKLMPCIKAEIDRANAIEQKARVSSEEKDLIHIIPFLQSVPVEVLSAITILSCLKHNPNVKDPRSQTITSLITALGQWVEAESEIATMSNNSKHERWRDLSRLQSPKALAIMRRRRAHAADLNELGEDTVLSPTQLFPWSHSVRVKIGAMLFSLLADVATIEVSQTDPETKQTISATQPALFHTHIFVRGKRTGMVKLHPALIEKLSIEPTGASLARFLPMLTSPQPWTDFKKGGFLEQAVDVVRQHDRDPCSMTYAKTASKNGDMQDVFAGLNALGAVPWRINRNVFDVMSQAWNSGQAIATIPAESPVIEMPVEPDASEGPRARARWVRRSREIQNALAGFRSQRAFLNFQLETARAFVDEVFYFPHNVDFRGRAYPMTPFLNHMGADNARGLLVFAKGKELGQVGLWWLKVHLANLYGYDKASFTERQQFAEDHMDDIKDSAENPLNGRRWWLTAEDPWQLLATCFELHAAYKLDDPTKLISHLPVHQDGTCNGLQHYAALGGDVVGAKQVNLEPGDRPADIYTAVAEAVKAEVADEARAGFEVAKLLDGRLTRKVVKQTVMTNVYGVTFIGAQRQVRSQLVAIFKDFPDTSEINLTIAASYIASKIFRTLGTMFNGAHDIQYWLGDCGQRICQSLSPIQIQEMAEVHVTESDCQDLKMKIMTMRHSNKGNERLEALTSFITPIIWTTPLRMPVVQPYRKEASETVRTRSQGISLSRATRSSVVDKVRQLQAFPPNFIHSLDGTHMFLTAMQCTEAGLSFAAVHDSFWTHACDVDTMSRITRDAFIRMHGEDIIGRLLAELRTRHQGYMHRMPVDASSAVGQAIKQWRTKQLRGHSSAKKEIRVRKKVDEILLESERLRLLASEDPEEQAQGKAMVTGASIFESYQANETSSPMQPKEPRPAILGGMSGRTAKLKANEQLEVGDVENVDPFGPSSVVDPASGNPAAFAEAIIDSSVVGAEDNTTPSDQSSSSESIRNAQDNPYGIGKVERKSSRPKTYGTPMTHVWVPLAFPPVPKKGDFDVRKLKDSLYFFS